MKMGAAGAADAGGCGLAAGTMATKAPAPGTTGARAFAAGAGSCGGGMTLAEAARGAEALALGRGDDGADDAEIVAVLVVVVVVSRVVMYA